MTETERVREATRSYLEEYPDNESVIETLLERESFSFDETPLDSGTFGELVSREFVVSTDDGYQFTEPETVAAVLAETDQSPSDRTAPEIEFSLPSVDPRVAGGLLFALVFAAATRSMYYSTIIREEHILSPANDPYFYRYWQAQLLEHSAGPMDSSMLATVGEQTRIRPLTHFLNWWFAEPLGADVVAALQPTVATVLLALTLFGLTAKLTADSRIALAAVLLLALTPVHAVYTGLGFLEHRPYQYLWVGVMAFSTGWLAVDFTEKLRSGHDDPALGHLHNPRAWLVAGVLAIGVAGMAHTWGGSPLSFVPLGVYFGFRVVVDCRERVDPLLANGPALAGFVVGTLLAFGIHRRWGWHESIAVTTPAVIAFAAVAVAVLATVWYRLALPHRGLLVAEGVLSVIAVEIFRRLRPEDIARLQERADSLFARDSATETASLLTTDQAVIFGPLFQLGIGFYLALLPLGFATLLVARRYEPAWLAAVCFTWFYFGLAVIQVRFAAQFSIFVALFGAVGLLYLLGAVELVRKPTLFERTAPSNPSIALPQSAKAGTYLVALVVIILVFNILFVSTLLGQVQHSDEQFEAAMTIEEHTSEHAASHPETFVLSEWGDNRMYNFFVSGQSRGYGYAQSNHASFVTDTAHPDTYYEQFSGRVGYLVLTDLGLGTQSVQTQLFEEFGISTQSTAHYKLLYADGDVRAFALVEGAQLDLELTPNTNVTARTTVTAAGESFEYQRNVTTDENGTATLRVAYPGEYDVDGETVVVPEAAVYTGESIAVRPT